jgi:hypothetical protein
MNPQTTGHTEATGKVHSVCLVISVVIGGGFQSQTGQRWAII